MSASQQLAAFNYAVPPSSNLKIKNITAAYTVLPSDVAAVINCTSGTFTLSLTAAATLGTGFNVTVWNTGTGSITIAANGTDEIDGAGSSGRPILYTGQGVMLVCNGTAWNTAFGRTNQVLSFKSSNSSAGARGYPLASASFAIAIGQTNTNNSNVVASGNGAVAIGINSSFSQGSQATASGSTALGGSYASGTDSFAAGIANNTSTYGAQGANSVAIGRQAKATVTSAIAIGDTTQATGSGGYCLAMGYQSQATSPGAIAIGFQYYGAGATLASGGSSVAIGDHVNASERFSFASGNGALAAQIGKEARASGFFAAIGDAQYGQIVLRIATTDATATRLTSNAAAAGTTNQLILANNQAMTVTGTVLCRQSVAGSDKASGWTFTAVIRRGANAASTALVAAVTPVLVAQDLSLATTVLAITADTTNGGLAVTVTGIAATNLRWVATLQTSECTYA